MRLIVARTQQLTYHKHRTKILLVPQMGFDMNPFQIDMDLYPYRRSLSSKDELNGRAATKHPLRHQAELETLQTPGQIIM